MKENIMSVRKKAALWLIGILYVFAGFITALTGIFLNNKLLIQIGGLILFVPVILFLILLILFVIGYEAYKLITGKDPLDS